MASGARRRASQARIIRMVSVVCRVRAVVLFLAAGATGFGGENVWTTNGPLGGISALAVAPDDPIVYAGASLDGRSLGFRTLNHGADWMVIGEAPQPSSISSFAIDPGDSGNVLAAVMTGGLLGSSTIFQSRDGGETWLRVATLASDVFALAYHPTRPGTVFAVGARWRCFQAPCFPYSRLGPVILRSVDSGATWTEVTGGLVLAGAPIVAVTFDSTEPDRIYTASGSGISISEDGGDHWMLSVSGMEGCLSTTALATDPRIGGVVFAGTTWTGRDPYACGAVFRSLDGGRTWTRTSLSSRDVTSLAIDPQNPGTLYAGIASSNPIHPDTGVFRSTDRGETWERFGVGLPESGVRALVIEPTGKTLHAATSAGVFDYEVVAGARPPVIPARDRETRTLPGRP